MKVHGIVFDEVKIPLYQQHSKAAIQGHAPAGRSPYGKVPILHDGDITVWDSLAIWASCRASTATGGAFLFGNFGIADAMYAPVVLRFSIYQIPLPAAARDYLDTILALPALHQWIADARTETEVLAQFER